MKRVCILALCGFAVGMLLGTVRSAHAVNDFKKEFESVYVKKQPTSEAEKSLLAAVNKAKCNVCHVGTSKKERNEYGKALATFLTKKDAKNTEKIHEALEKVAGMKSKSDDPNSPTFGELIQQGKLPCEGAPVTETAGK
jgi:hypothetical protein